MESRPIIFFHPLNPTLKKLKEKLENEENDPPVDVYETDDQAEMIQLFTSLGSSVVMTSDPKKCLRFLNQMKLLIRKNSSKINRIRIETRRGVCPGSETGDENVGRRV